MNRKMLSKLVIDLVMTVLMLAAMAYSVTGNTIHELVGVFVFVLFIVHNILNRRWYQTVLKGKNDAVRVLNTAVNLLLLVTMAALIKVRMSSPCLTITPPAFKNSSSIVSPRSTTK